jgi:hypothetical protein
VGPGGQGEKGGHWASGMGCGEAGWAAWVGRQAKAGGVVGAARLEKERIRKSIRN